MAMADAPPIQSAAEIDYPPFSIVHEDGRADGFSVELMRAALKAMNRDVTFRTGPWAEVRGWLERGEVQALPLVGRTPERENLLGFTFAYMTLHGAIVVREDNRDIHTIGDLWGRQVAVMKGDNAEEFLRREERGIHIHTTPTFEGALRRLSDGRCDAVVIQRLVALRLLQETGISNLRVLEQPIEGFKQDFCFAVREGDRDTLALLNEGLAIVMADGTYRQLHAKWFAALQLPTDRRIVVGGDHAYPPFEYLEENGRPAGYNVELTRAIALEMGLDIEIRLGPWAEIVKGMEEGRIDVLQGMFYLPERDLKFDFTQPHAVHHYVSFVRKGEGDPPVTVDDLAGKRIVVQRGDAAHDFLLAKGLGGQVSLVESQEDVLRQLAEGKHDCALAVRISSLYLIEENGWKNLVLGRQAFLPLEYCYAALNNRKAVLAQFSEGLKVLEKNGQYRRIYDKWLGGYEERPPSLVEALRYSVMVLIPLSAILLVVFLWSWTLRRRVAERTKDLHESEEKYRSFFENSMDAILLTAPDGSVFAANPSACELFGRTEDEIIKLGREGLVDATDPRLHLLLAEREKNRKARGEITFFRKDGSRFSTEVTSASFEDSAGEIKTSMIIRDITEREAAEAEQEKLRSQLIQAQKMESVGRLAGGVAHDFNNKLSVILGYTELAMGGLGKTTPIYENLQQVMEAGKQSVNIVRQLLAFARKQTIVPRVLDFNETVEGMLKMLRRLIGEDIDLLWRPDTNLWRVQMDPAQIGQILANLCINARDAISGVGRITIETENVVLDESYCADRVGFVPGEYVMLAVSDDGSGMDKEILANAFEPFFTTKEVGKGTGLGLATVYGIAKQNQGFVNIYSEPEKGTCVKIYLPRHREETEKKVGPIGAETPRGDGETILVVEDETSVLHLARRILEKMGYVVLTSATPTEAVATAREYAGEIHLLMTDVVLPEMSGKDLAGEVMEIRPNIGVLFMSGYTANVIAHQGVLDKGVQFIEKPFTSDGLARKVREALRTRKSEYEVE
ncbi:MAG TPA: transporter substrate-binding domain-containing protein [Desulfobacteraceae bacterium]|nr:transporter substrate-binding domain-containing protein [Desulfobacteraceae bacterium]